MKIKTKEDLARQAVAYYLQTGKYLDEDLEIPPGWQKRGACFVTLTLDGQLRGCIGNLEANQPLYREIIQNAIAAAVSDWRFPPVSLAELPRLEFEVSVLSPLKKLPRPSPEKLLSFLARTKPGLVLENKGKKAVYLPSVWEQLADPEEFLRSLALKAGLDPDDWRERSARFWIFKVLP
jgi:AmmeMemoRadiSam system protein A